MKTLLANISTKSFIKGQPTSSDGPKTIPRNPPYFSILCNRFFDNFILADELFKKTLHNLKTLLVITYVEN